MTSPFQSSPLWCSASLPAGWEWARVASHRDARAAGCLVRRNMKSYWKARGMRFSLSIFLEHWPEQQSILWRPTRHRVHGVLSWTIQNDHAHLCELQLDEGYRGQGIGSAILLEWLLECYQQGIRMVELKVFRDNPAYRLYTRLGFWALAVDPDIPGFMTMRCYLNAQQIGRYAQFARPSSLSA